MPSWNIHTAHVERLEREYDLAGLGIQDMNTFLFGNFLPDVYVGFMVPDASMHIDYRLTHMSEGGTIPQPDAGRFWEFYNKPRFHKSLDLIWGVWAHLVCDHVYNQATHELLELTGTEVNDHTRQNKQSDFDLFGHTLAISKRVELTAELVQSCYDFPQYRVLEEDVERAVQVANGIVDNNQRFDATQGCEYRLLNEDFFAATFERVHEALVRGFDSMRQERRAQDSCN